MAGFISISGHSLTRRNTVSRGTGLPDSALGHPSGSFRPTRPTLGHADATQRSRARAAALPIPFFVICFATMAIPAKCGIDDLATLLGISARRVTQLVEKKVLLREARGTFDVCDSVHRFIAHRETVVAQEHGVGAYGKARADVTGHRYRQQRRDSQSGSHGLARVQKARDA
jgi:hypothetical protein